MSSIEAPETVLEQAAALIRHARSAIVLTGAGFSTPSGIPDFRTPSKGMWEQADPMQVASLTTFHQHPERFFDWFRPLTRSICEASPNAAHQALAELERAGYIQAVITQNIDGLHQEAGSRNVLELHGSLRSLSCLECDTRRPAQPFLPAYVASGTIPICPDCGAMLKPDIVFFEEMLPQDTWQRAARYCQGCDLLLVVGSSLEVSPASQLPRYALEHRARLIVNNRTSTYLDRSADLIFREDLEKVIPAIATYLL
jgi:NAD-dependent deacetylase